VKWRPKNSSTEESATVPAFQSILLVTFGWVSPVLQARMDRSILKETSPLQCLLATLMSFRTTSCLEQVCRYDIKISTRKSSPPSLTLVYFGDLLLGVHPGPGFFYSKTSDADTPDERSAAQHSGINDLGFNPNGQFSKSDRTKGSTNVSQIARLMTETIMRTIC